MQLIFNNGILNVQFEIIKKSQLKSFQRINLTSIIASKPTFNSIGKVGQVNDQFWLNQYHKGSATVDKVLWKKHFYSQQSSTNVNVNFFVRVSFWE